MIHSITPVILTRDEAPNIARTLGQLQWAREVVVVDSGSTDGTTGIAKAFANVRVVHRSLDDLASQWTFAVAQATTPWVLTLDADYFVPDAFTVEARSLDPDDVAAYEASFRYAVNGKILRASLYPPREVLLRRDRCSFFMDGHTQRTAVAGPILSLETRFIHDDRKSFGRFLERQRRYMREEAQKIRSGRKLGAAGRIRRLRVVAPFAVLGYTLFVKGVILDGRPGLRYAAERFAAELILTRELFRSPR